MATDVRCRWNVPELETSFFNVIIIKLLALKFNELLLSFHNRGTSVKILLAF